MTCIQITSGNPPPTNATIPLSSGGYKTEAECNQACQEGACCNGATCTVKPACQCQGAGQVFKGAGTTCSPNPCLCCCEFFDLHAGGAMVYQQVDSSCVSSNNRKTAACVSTPLVVSVSGVKDASWSGETGFQTAANKNLSFANTSQTSSEICGQSAMHVEGPAEINSGFFVASSTLDVSAWFSPYDSLHDVSSDACSNGSVRFRVELTLRRIYGVGSYAVGYPLVYKGFYKGDCTTLDSFPASSSMLAGKTVTMTCDGSFSYNGYPGWSYPAAPQTITVSFAANPLP